MMGRDPATSIADPDRERLVTRSAGPAAYLAVAAFVAHTGAINVAILAPGHRHGDLDRVALPSVLHGRSEGVLQKLGQDVLKMSGDVCDCRFGRTGHDDGWSDPVFQLAQFRDKVFAQGQDRCWFQGSVDHADVGRSRIGRWRWIGAVGLIGRMRLGGEVQGYMLLCDETSTNPCAEMLIQESCHGLRGNILSALEETAGKHGDGVGMRLD